jgi:hypothetical protein
VPLQYLLSSLVFLVIGLLYLVGLVAGWRSMKSRTAQAAQIAV